MCERTSSPGAWQGRFRRDLFITKVFFSLMGVRHSGRTGGRGIYFLTSTFIKEVFLF